ncbi:MAG: DUF1295 domain-containing protein [Oceanococcaceae bacterium]
MHTLGQWAIVLITVAVGCGLALLAGGRGPQWAGLPALFWLALLAYGVQWLAFVPAYLKQTEHYYDLTGSATYLLLLGLGLYASQGQPMAWLLGGAAGLWALRLGSFLFRRVRKAGKDGRFDEIKPDFVRFLIAWTMQGLWVFLTLLATLIAMTAPAQAIGMVTILGLLIWAMGFAIEAVADAQKSAFNADPAHTGRFVNVGLWRWSRHPNYFGEILLWTGMALAASPVFVAWEWLGWLSPLFVALLLIKISGVPLLEQRSDAKWGGQADYEAYKRNTPVLMLRPPSP